ncbi:hypothetical protein VULLAG_LOCUS21994 [Vulpes lagopus]
MIGGHAASRSPQAPSNLSPLSCWGACPPANPSPGQGLSGSLTAKEAFRFRLRRPWRQEHGLSGPGTNRVRPGQVLSPLGFRGPSDGSKKTAPGFLLRVWGGGGEGPRGGGGRGAVSLGGPSARGAAPRAGSGCAPTHLPRAWAPPTGRSRGAAPGLAAGLRRLLSPLGSCGSARGPAAEPGPEPLGAGLGEPAPP